MIELPSRIPDSQRVISCTMPGYSGTPLVSKLGIKPAHRVVAVGAPPGFGELLGPLPENAVMATRWPTKPGGTDIVLLFVTRQRAYEKLLSKAERAIHDAGSIWIAWPKKSSGVETDLTENTIRDVALLGRLVDNKVCAIDNTWSGLRLVVRIAARVAKPKSDLRGKKAPLKPSPSEKLSFNFLETYSPCFGTVDRLDGSGSAPAEVAQPRGG